MPVYNLRLKRLLWPAEKEKGGKDYIEDNNN
jgi:hypothetical protein